MYRTAYSPDSMEFTSETVHSLPGKSGHIFEFGRTFFDETFAVFKFFYEFCGKVVHRKNKFSHNYISTNLLKVSNIIGFLIQ